MILVKEKGLRESGSLCFKILGDLRQIPGSMLESAPPTTVKGCCSHKIHHSTKISNENSLGKGFTMKFRKKIEII